MPINSTLVAGVMEYTYKNNGDIINPYYRHSNILIIN